MSAAQQHGGDFTSANFPLDSEGRPHHILTRPGEVANRILSVGDPDRARRIAQSLDDPTSTFVQSSHRGFTVYTGLYNGVPVSIVGTGMGIPMIDFLIREARAIVRGPMCIVRFGTCGSINSDVTIGTLAVSNDSRVILRNPDAWLEEGEVGIFDRYKVSKAVDATPCVVKSLHSNLEASIKASKDEVPLKICSNLTADTFYASQGRTGASFADHNEELVDSVNKSYPDVATFEMETFQLFHLSKCSNPAEPISCGAVKIVLASRHEGEMLSHENKNKLEVLGGAAILKALTEQELAGAMVDGVWNKKE